ncbi:MAG: U32 family peptidase [Bacteroidales bacterium]|nr:U32 family peptidase [Bacteroidales bacterium]
MEQIEIMAPVGSYESLMAALQAGADAVYFGVGNLNMRSRSAHNFGLDDLRRIVSIAQQHHVRTYLTVNTVVYDTEMDEMRTLIDTAQEAGVSAIIASDPAAIAYAHSIGVEVHISTQCNVSNVEAVRFYAQFADVMVTARELSLRQVAAITEYIRENNIRGPHGDLVRIEIFCHGALCMSVSGKCYLSLDTYNYSANRGSCLQLCRREYLVKDVESDVELLVDNKYIMSPKDLKTIDFLDKIVRAGVRVLKIEGRGRSADYVKTVVSCYREALQAIADGTYTPEAIAEWNRRLATVYNRGFWDGYYLGRRMGEWTERYGSQATETKIYIGKVTNYFYRINVAEIRLETANELSVGDRYMVTGTTTGVYEDVVQELRVDLQPTQCAVQGQDFSMPTTTPLRRGDKVYKIVSSVDEF